TSLRSSRLFPYTTLFRSVAAQPDGRILERDLLVLDLDLHLLGEPVHRVLVDAAKVARLRVLVEPRSRLRITDAHHAGLAHLGKRSEEHTSELQSLRHLVC